MAHPVRDGVASAVGSSDSGIRIANGPRRAEEALAGAAEGLSDPTSSPSPTTRAIPVGRAIPPASARILGADKCNERHPPNGGSDVASTDDVRLRLIGPARLRGVCFQRTIGE